MRSSLTWIALLVSTVGLTTGAALRTGAANPGGTEADAAPGQETVRTDLSPADRARVEAVLRPPASLSMPQAFEAMSGGAATSTAAADRRAFSHPLPNLDPASAEDAALGQALFEKLWVSSPSSTQASDGLGPLFNARACATCHPRGGAGAVEGAPGLTLHLMRAAKTAAERTRMHEDRLLALGDDLYGRQLQDQAVPGLAAEGRVEVTRRERLIQLSGGAVVTLRQPVYRVVALAGGPLQSETLLSPRLAGPLIGLGLIEAIADRDLQENAERQAGRVAETGIAGRLRDVRDPATGGLRPGRFGWKAENASLRAQSAAALSLDIGISTTLVPRPAGDCTDRQTTCLGLPNGVQTRLGPVEAPDAVLNRITTYSATLAPPVRRTPADPRVLQGKALFHAAGCAICHQPNYVTRRDAADPALAFQLIWPYSDFLLHDMGEDLADRPPEDLPAAAAQPSDRPPQIVRSPDDLCSPAGCARPAALWRTPPLWGLGLRATVSPPLALLHDGRAGSLAEAILWHGGEATKARVAFQSLAPADRAALFSFLESL